MKFVLFRRNEKMVKQIVNTNGAVFGERKKLLLDMRAANMENPKDAHKIVNLRQVSDLRVHREKDEINIEELIRIHNGPQAR